MLQFFTQLGYIHHWHIAKIGYLGIPLHICLSDVTFIQLRLILTSITFLLPLIILIETLRWALILPLQQISHNVVLEFHLIFSVTH